MAYFRTTIQSGPVPNSSAPMKAVFGEEFFYSSQWTVLSFSAEPALMGNLPGYMVPSVLGTDFPFKGNQEGVDFSSKRRSSYVKDLLGDRSVIGRPLTITASAPDTTPILPIQKLQEFDWGKYLPLKKYQQKAASEKPGWTMFPEFIPAASYSTISCDLLSEIQRHMLEPVVDGGLTWSDFWTKAEIQKFLNNRLSRFFLETGVIQREFSIAVQSGISEYNYPSDLIQAKRLTFEEQLSLYDGLVSFWRLEEASGTRFDAYGSNHLTGVLNSPTNAIGKIGNSYNGTFVGNSGSFITNANQSGLNPGTGDFSISFWIYANTFSGAINNGTYIVSKGATGSAPGSAGYSVGVYSSSSASILAQKLFVSFGDNSSSFPYLQYHASTALTTETWYHIALVFKRSSFLECYINKVRIGPNADGSSDNMNFFGSNTGSSTPAAVFAIGALAQNQGITSPTSGFSFNGRIDAVGYWNRALTSDEISTLYNEGNGRELYLGQHDGPYVVLPRMDPFSEDNAYPGWQDETGTPSSIIEEPRSPLSFQLAPTPDVAGSVEGIYVADPEAIGDACVPLPIPNYLSWIIKYGVMSDMLRKEGEANDPKRAEYCESRWREGVQLTRMLLGWNDADVEDTK